MHLVLGLVLSAAIGLSLGLIGGGGSIITVPVLVYVLGVEAREAVAMSLAVVGVTSLVAAGLHARRGAIDVKTGLLFGGAGVAGAFFGSRLTYLVSPATLLLSFAALMLVVATVMLVKRGSDREEQKHERSAVKGLAAGLAVGVLTGFLGVGGGFLVVPALVLFGGLAMREAVGTSLVVIAINCAAGLAGHLQHGGFDPTIAALVTGLAAIGTLAGAALSHRANPARLKTIFALFVIAVALFLLAENFDALPKARAAQKGVASCTSSSSTLGVSHTRRI
jgi:uncharacterized membrane protein YfcA